MYLAVVDLARKYWAKVHRGALSDPRLSLRVEDGLAFVRASTETYDLIVLDLTDPGGPSAPLYDADFYRACAARLKPSGAMSLHIASPVAHPDRIRAGIADPRAAFAIVVPSLASIHRYGGLWMMACASATLNPSYLTPLEADRRISQRGIRDLQYYNGDVHRASMALPHFARELVQTAACPVVCRKLEPLRRARILVLGSRQTGPGHGGRKHNEVIRYDTGRSDAWSRFRAAQRGCVRDRVPSRAGRVHGARRCRDGASIGQPRARVHPWRAR